MATVTWGRRSGSWAFPTYWRPLVTPGTLDVALFTATDISTATIAGPIAVGGLQIAAGSFASVLLQDTLTLAGQFDALGGTVELDAGGAIVGGTVDLTGAVLVANGGVIDGAVWIGALGRGVTVTGATLTATEQARDGAALSVIGTLDLATGSYGGVVLSLDAFGTSGAAEVDVVDGGVVLLDSDMRVVLSQDDPDHVTGSNPAGAGPILGGAGTLANGGLILSDAISATLASDGMVNFGSIELDNATVPGEQQSFLGADLLTWTATFAPTMTIASPDFENDGTITGAGATLDITGTAFVNSGLIALGQSLAQAPILMPQPHLGVIALLSTLDIAAGVSSFSNTGTLSANTIELDGSVDLATLGTLLGTVVFAGTLDLGGGTLNAASLASATSYVVTGTVRNGTIVDSLGRIDTSAATLDQVAIINSPADTVLDVQGPGTIVLDSTLSELAYTTAATIHGLTVSAGAFDLLDRIGIRAGTLTFASDTVVSDTIAGTALAIGGGVFVENGRIDLDASNLEVATLDGTGTISLADDAVLTIDSIAPTADITIVFGRGTNALILPADASGLGALGLTLTGLQAGDLIDFSAVSADPGTVFAQAGAGLSDGTLDVQGASGDQASLSTNATGLTFAANTDPNGGTILTVACFRAGTRLATPTGERAVELLRIGDRVVAQSGQTRRITWPGRRAYLGQLVRQQRQLRPVRIARGALGGGLPRRPLDLSPLHALLIDGLLIPAGLLVNGRTIRRAPAADTEYIHVELDHADIVLAEGAPCESFVDCDNRTMFDNAAEFAALYPRMRPSRWTFPVPRVEEGWPAEAVRTRLAGRALTPIPTGALHGAVEHVSRQHVRGWARNADDPAHCVELELVAAGRQLGCIVANRYRDDLDWAGAASSACGFTAELPALDAADLASLTLVRLTDGAILHA